MIRKANIEDLKTLTALALKLWPDHDGAELEADLSAILALRDAAFFLAEEAGTVGFAQCQLRHDYVEGCEHAPAGYLEGIYVRPAYRRKGAAAALLDSCRAWARAQGCCEFASDCELENSESAAFHAAMGFREASRNIHFVQSL